MAFRSDISIQWNLSPRIITVAAPSVELTIQDLHDTLREHEAYAENMVYPNIISSAGKESLGGGVRVGLTSTLLNAKVAFEARKTPTHSGVVTTDDLTGRILIDSTATFITDGIQPGAWIVNYEDGSICSVLTVDSETQLTTNVLGVGIDSRFQVGDAYRVQNVVQCDIAGGNLVAIDTLGTDISPVLPTAGTQIVRTSSASATLQELSDIQFSSFDGGITIDILSSYSGIDYPVGTPRAPVNNLDDAIMIAQSRGLRKIYVVGSLIINGSTYVEDLTFEGDSPTSSNVTILASATVINCTFVDVTISGSLDGGSHIHNCRIDDLEYVNGFIESSVINSTIKLVGDAHFLDCWSGVPGSTTPIIDFNNTNSKLALRNYNGGILLRNKNFGEPSSVDLNSGQVILENTVTSGTIVIRGVGKLTNNSTGSAVIDSSHLLSPGNIAAMTWNTDISGSTAANRLGSVENLINITSDALVAGQTTAQVSSTSTAIRTTLTQSDGFFDGMLFSIIGSSGACVRAISYYENISGTLHTEDPLPFTPTSGDTIYVLMARSSRFGGAR